MPFTLAFSKSEQCYLDTKKMDKNQMLYLKSSLIIQK